LRNTAVSQQSTAVTVQKGNFDVKLLPAPHVPGNTEAAPIDSAVRKMFTASKQTEAKEKRETKLAAKKLH
jgi:hypothetical protein